MSLYITLDDMIIQGVGSGAVFSTVTKTLTVSDTQFIAAGSAAPIVIQGAGLVGDISFLNCTFTGGTGNRVQFSSVANTTGYATFTNSTFEKISGTISGYGIYASALTADWEGIEIDNSTFGSAATPFTGNAISVDEYADEVNIHDSEFYLGSNDDINGLLIGVDGASSSNPLGNVEILNNSITYIGSMPAGHAVLLGSGVDSGDFKKNTVLSTSLGSGNIGLVVKGESNDIRDNVISAARGIDLKGGNSNTVYNNTVIAKSLYALQLDDSGGGTYSSNNSIKNNIFDASSGTYSIYYSQSYITSNIENALDYNIYNPGSSGIAYDSSNSISNITNLRTMWSVLAAPYNTSDQNSIENTPQLSNLPGNDFSLTVLSPAIDAGIDIGQTIDSAGNPIYGNPDLGPYEFQPTSTIGSNEIDIAGNARIYADGKFRNTEATSGNTADLSITPDGGFGTGDYSEWMDVSISEWNTSGNYAKTWTEESDTIGADPTLHTVGDLAPNGVYILKVDGTQGADISSTDCTSGLCTANGSGEIAFTYTGGYSSHTFTITQYVAPTPTPAPSSSSNSSSSSRSSSPSAPGCSDKAPAGTPDLFQIDRTGKQAKLFFTPVNDSVQSYNIIFGHYDGDERFGGISMQAQNENKGVQSITIDHLDPKASYSFKVISTNGCATGEWSNWLSTGKLQGKTSIFYRYWDKVRNIF